MRASLAVPGVFAPVRVNGRLVVDGGLVRNLPVDMARAMGADIVIAVNVGTPLAPEKSWRSALGVAQQMIHILTEQNVQRSLRELRAQDVLVAPDLAGVGFLDFGKHDQAIRAGEAAARALAARLAPLALPPKRTMRGWKRARLARRRGRRSALPLGRIDVRGDGRVNPDVLAADGPAEGRDAHARAGAHGVRTLYGRDDIDRVDTEIADDGGGATCSIRPTESPWAAAACGSVWNWPATSTTTTVLR